MRKIYIAVGLILLVGCNNDNRPKLVGESGYPHIIDSLNLHSLYNETKWRMYCVQCDDTLHPIKQSTISDTITFGMLELRFDTVQISDKGTELNFMFYNKGQRCGVSNMRNSSIRGVVYGNKGEVRYHSMYTDAFGLVRDSCPPNIECKSRFINPVQPEVIRYINNNKAGLNTWFYKEAKKRGVLKD